MLFLMPNRQCQSTEGTSTEGAESGKKKHKKAIMDMLRSISKVLFFHVLKTFLNILLFFSPMVYIYCADGYLGDHVHSHCVACERRESQM